MAGRECYHCKQRVEPGERHDCWTTTEAALTRDLTEDLLEAWERLRETAAAFGEQRIYASHKSIMFSRRACYFFVRPKKNFLELCVFLGRPLAHPRVRRVDPSSRSKFAHTIQVRHRDEVEPPLTDWLHEAYVMSTLVRRVPATKVPATKALGTKGLATKAVGTKGLATKAPATKVVGARKGLGTKVPSGRQATARTRTATKPARPRRP